ncbi:PDT-domain-containing protein [Saccharata proteae CBS 121410]|uniref:prephenate dehydratase n=1 Tax=Saccharata proteae CBS 121410 TaxID=1314787 RepID=A0A9P4HXL8_9PEZI|nr:PDT-domain-containing protein [Saccharata proteae CBS 121410]
MEHKETVAFLGPRASYTHQAALDSFPPTTHTLHPVTTIEDVFASVQHGDANYGVVPWENSSNGAVVFTLDLFADVRSTYPDIHVIGEAYVRVQHCLLGHAPAQTATQTASGTVSSILASSLSSPIGSDAGSGAATPTLETPAPHAPRTAPLRSLAGIKRVYSHPMAWGQCKEFLATYLKGVERLDCSSTSRAAEEAAKDESGVSAAISSAIAKEMLGLEFLARGIEDKEDNTTRFFIIKKGGGGEGTRGESLVSFTVDNNNPGALADSLAVFKPYRLNLTSINARPSGVEKWNYIFFVEFRGRRFEGEEGAVDSALRDLGQVTRSWRWLGSWESKEAI